jgi:hypothetical protein
MCADRESRFFGAYVEVPPGVDIRTWAEMSRVERDQFLAENGGPTYKPGPRNCVPA